MANRVSVVFDADTRQFKAEVDAATGSVRASAQAAADAKNKIVALSDDQIAAAKKAGASTEELTAIQRRAAMQLANVTEQNANRVIASLDRIVAKQKAVAAELANLPTVKGTDAGHGFTDRMATSAVVRAGEGTTSIRAIESFITMIPGATAAAQGLAMVIGGAGLIGLVAELGEKGVEAFTQLRNASQAAAVAADDLHAKTQVSIDDKEIENSKLQDQIDKLSGHPNNGLATALLEAKKAADQLLPSLANDRKEMEELFKMQDRGFAATALHDLFGVGDADTKQQRKELLQGQLDLEAQVSRDRNDPTKVNQDIDGRMANLRKERKRLVDEQEKSKQDAVDSANAGTGYASRVIDNTTKIRNIDTNLDVLQARKTDIADDVKGTDLRKTLGQVEQDRANKKLGDEAARKAAEAQRQRFSEQASQAEMPIDFATGLPKDPATPRQMYDLREQQRQSALPQNRTEAEKAEAQAYQEWLRTSTAETLRIRQEADKAEREQAENQLAALKADHNMTADEEATYWQSVTLTSTQGSQAQVAAERKENEALARVREERLQAMDAQNRAAEQQASLSARQQEATIALEEQTGQISKYDAAVQLANVHTQQYASQIAALKAELAKQQALDPDSAATVNAQSAVVKAQADRAIQIQQDAAKVSAENWLTALKQANALWIQDSQDSAGKVKSLYAQTLNGFNDTISGALTDKHQPGETVGKELRNGFADNFRGLGRSVVTTGLQKAEGGIMGALGLGKPDGSSSNPLYVRMAEGIANVGQGASSILSGIRGMFSGSGSTSATSGGSDNGVGQIADIALGGFAKALSFGGGFALGGDVSPGKTITVGEMGPEELTLGPGTAAHVTPNSGMQSGPQVSNTFHVANGVTPEAMKMYVENVMTHYHNNIMPSGAVAAVKGHNQRIAPSRQQ